MAPQNQSGRSGADPVQHPDVADVRRALDVLTQAVGRLQARHTETLGVRRLASDVRRMSEDLDEIGDLIPAEDRAAPTLHFVPDDPYPADLWQGADDEGLDGRAR